MNIGQAIELMKTGKSVTRPGWGSARLLVFVEESSQKALLGFCSDDHPVQTYTPSSDEMLGEDWVEYVPVEA